MNQLISGSLSTGSQLAYKSILCQFTYFLSSFCLDDVLPIPPVFIALYVAWLHSRGLAGSSITSHISAIAFLLKLANVADSTQGFLVKRALLGVRNSSNCPDPRLPITLALVLWFLLQSFSSTVGSPYNRFLFRAMFTLAFFAFLRVGELCVSHGVQQNTIRLDQLQFNSVANNFYLIFHKFKHSRGKPFLLRQATAALFGPCLNICRSGVLPLGSCSVCQMVPLFPGTSLCLF